MFHVWHKRRNFSLEDLSEEKLDEGNSQSPKQHEFCFKGTNSNKGVQGYVAPHSWTKSDKVVHFPIFHRTTALLKMWNVKCELEKEPSKTPYQSSWAEFYKIIRVLIHVNLGAHKIENPLKPQSGWLKKSKRQFGQSNFQLKETKENHLSKSIFDCLSTVFSWQKSDREQCSLTLEKTLNVAILVNRTGYSWSN